MLYRNYNSLKEFDVSSAVAIGNFDGVHIGHQKIIKELVAVAAKNNYIACVILFEPHPKEYFGAQGNYSRLSNLRDKYNMLRSLGVDIVICCKFNQDFANISHHNFLHNILLAKLMTKFIIVGDDFCFGKNRLGNIEFMLTQAKKYNFTVVVKQKIKLGKYIVSSSVIRELLQHGDFDLVNKLLGRGFVLNIKAVKGIVSNYGLFIIREYMAPPNGIYLIKIDIRGVANYFVATLTRGALCSRSHRYLSITSVCKKNMVLSSRIQVCFVAKIN